MSGVYAYTARSEGGAFVAGTLAAESPDAALAHLQTRALYVTSLEGTGTLKGAATGALILPFLDPGARVSFFRSFATMIGAGVAMRRALDVAIENCRDARFREALRSVASDVEIGRTLSFAMSQRPREFSRLFVAMVRAGEVGGALHEVLERLATLLERDRAMRKRVGAALAYPAFVTVAALLLVMFLVANVVPAFAGMFAQMHVTLPLSTRVLIVIGTTLQDPLVWIGLGCLALASIFAVRTAKRSSAWALRIDAAILATPVLGTLLRKTTIARMSRTLGTLLRSGVALSQALDASRDVLGSAVYERCLNALAESLRRGESMSRSLAESGLFDGLYLQLVRVGEETGTLDAMLLRVAEYYELDIETAIAALGGVLEPLLIVVLGAIVGTIVASVLIPLYSIIGSIK